MEQAASGDGALLDRVGALAPAHLLLLATGVAEADRLAALHGSGRRVSRRDRLADLGGLAGLEPGDLAVLAAPPARLLEAGLTQVLARLRDQLAGNVIVTCGEPVAEPAVRRHLLSLGYQPLDGLPGCFGFDLASYNPPRDWNSPEHWAHPENFDRHRW